MASESRTRPALRTNWKMTEKVGHLLTKLLLALDGSQLAEELLAKLRFLPSPKDVELLLLHCLDLNSLAGPPGHSDYEHQLQAKQARCQSYLDRQLSQLSELGYTHVRTQLVIGPPRQSILNVAQAESVELIVVQTHGRSGLQWLFMGSVAEGVIRRSTCPVLVLPATAPEVEP